MSTRLDTIREAVTEAVNEVDRILPLPESPERNKAGIEVHAKLEQAASALASYRKSARPIGQESVEVEVLRSQILGNVRRVLQEIFSLPEEDLPTNKPGWAAGFPTPTDEEPKPEKEPTVADGLVAIAGAINNLAQAIHYNALPEKRRRIF